MCGSGRRRHSSHAMQPSTSGAPVTGPASADARAALNFSTSRPLALPTCSVSAASATGGTASTNEPLASISVRVKVCLSSTTATLGGMKSSGMDHAAAITLRRPPDSALTSTVGP